MSRPVAPSILPQTFPFGPPFPSPPSPPPPLHLPQTDIVDIYSGDKNAIMSDSVPTKTAITAGLSLAVAGLAVGLAGPKLLEKIISKAKPGGKFSGVSALLSCSMCWLPGFLG